MCKHFNLTYIDIRDDLSWAEYICILAESLDAEEIEELQSHNQIVGVATAFHQPKKLKKWEWSSPDRAGTRGLGKQNVATGLASFALQIAEGKIQAGPSTHLIERAKATGRRVIYQTPDMQYFDEQGTPTERQSLDLIIQIGNDGRPN